MTYILLYRDTIDGRDRQVFSGESIESLKKVARLMKKQEGCTLKNFSYHIKPEHHKLFE